MPDTTREQLPHIILTDTASTERFSAISSGGGRPPALPQLDRATHGQGLLNRIETLKNSAVQAKQAQQDAGMESGFGIQVQFRSFDDVALAFESLPREKSGIELLNVQQDEHHACATVFVPEGKFEHFEKLITEYLEEKTDRNGKSRDHKALLNTIEDIRSATLEALWTDSPEALPENENEAVWWEVWLPVRGDRQGTLQQFRNIAEGIGFHLGEGAISFPERSVLLMNGTRRQIHQSMLLLNCVAELRRAKETAEFFDSFDLAEQREWVDDLLQRTTIRQGNLPCVCILDTGVNNGHPLLYHSLHASDQHTIDPATGVYDENGHGTRMAGIALYGDLTDALNEDGHIHLSHRLESVKLLRHEGGNEGIHHGHLTVDAVSQPETAAADSKRVFGLAVTATDSRDRGRPSAWSATLDRLAADSEGDGLSPRLLVVSAGNIQNNPAWLNYPASNSSDGIHDPGQAWNVLTVGAFTQKVRITEEGASGYNAIAPDGGLSPFSTTSMTWGRPCPWPLKPDVVMEGGNAANDGLGAVWTQSLSLLTTNHLPEERLLTTANATSAATYLCARMAAQLIAEYPDFWPETIRALIVHSAGWTEPMLQMFKTGGTPKEQYRRLIRHCGFGVPNLERAMWSATNSLTLIVQDTLQPFEKTGANQPKTRDMHLRRLPWPIAELETLGETQVEMRVTLSYFIEPNPAERGIKGRYRYESHGLRFDVKRPEETEWEFRARINRIVRDEEEGTATGGSDPGWDLGTNLRHLGSLHCDKWRGEAAKLAARGCLAVYPALGWWKTRALLARYNKQARYALIISINAPEVNVDIYNAVRTQIEMPVTIGI
ncbi:MAG: S8 family peptidase [Deltaproteobacteria bacterium]|nr:S8 family peptidase [Deltaproteobacteria bacterium]